MNILIVNGSADMYGANKILLQCIKFLQNRKVYLVVPSEGLLTAAINEQRSSYQHVEVIVFADMPLLYRGMGFKNGIRLLQKLVRFKRLIKNLQSDKRINWAYINTLSCLLSLKAVKMSGIKSLVHVHEILENHSILTREINCYGLKWSDKIIAVSEPVRENLLEVATKAQKNKVITVLNGIGDMCISDSLASTTERKIVITLFGRIKPEKGIWFFLDAIERLPKQSVEKCIFNIVGSPAPGGEQMVTKLAKDISEHKHAHCIHLQGFIPDIRQKLNQSDIIVVPSLMRDPFPTTILEAMSAGKPVIATKTGGAIQSVQDDVTGILIDAGNIDSFKDALQKLIESQNLRSTMGGAAREAFLQKFTMEIFAKNFMAEIEAFEKNAES